MMNTANKRKKKIAARKAEMKKRTASANKREEIPTELAAYYNRAFEQVKRILLPYDILGIGIAQFVYDIFSDMDHMSQEFEQTIKKKVAEKGYDPDTFRVIFADRKIVKEIGESIKDLKQKIYKMEKTYVTTVDAAADEFFYGKADALFDLVEPLRSIFEMVYEPASASVMEKRVKVVKAHIEKLRLQMDRNSKGALTLGQIIQKL